MPNMTHESSSKIPQINIGINGFGRIGRLVLRAALSHPEIKVRLINNPSTTPEYAAYLFKYDSTHGKYPGEVEFDDERIIIQNDEVSAHIPLSHFREPERIPWSSYQVDYVIDSTGAFKELDTASRHKGIKKVIITAPSKTAPMYVFGVNHKKYDPTRDNIVSNASCTTNCLAPLVKALDDEFGIEEALMTTIHATTASQKTVDGTSSGGKDWRGGRSCQGNIIPSSTGAAKAVGKILPELKDSITGMSIRVPTINISLVDLTFRTRKPTSYDEIISALELKSRREMKGVLGVTKDAVVSSDFTSDSRSSIVDAKAGIQLNDHFFKVLSWYDNEYGYSSRVVDLTMYMAQRDFEAGI
ncbi:glyceraldehyde-3-phosphate dehydrogenase 2 [Kluyveromyces marxianus]|uniref:Glyceraldehyde-3-phosphate dehydrogenase n=1 Tax=Kluyveromyces marxianus TaxID=4911 RepID=A0ABX6ER64_KLUMA|nr:glyceraldehyde-3-phosphate dehydrogenase 2 [Kluyveromyces marxianus]BAP70297.1 glyceraldehyde-3-phosphate dehydrogenase 2 [Kluyveromyces marxianus]